MPHADEHAVVAAVETPYGSVEVLHEGKDLTAWSIYKEAEAVDPSLSMCDRDDLLYVVEGSLRLELEGRGPIVLATGDLFVIPAGTRFRGYRWPRDGDPCRFLAVAPAGASFSPR